MLQQPDHDAIRHIKDQLVNNNDWLRRAVLAIYAMQTPQEQHAEQTREHNNRGFNGVDAELLTSFAKQILKGSLLSERQLAIARRKMPKYARQLLKIARAKASQAYTSSSRNPVPPGRLRLTRSPDEAAPSTR